MTLAELVLKLRNQVGDNHPTEPNITDTEMENIVNNTAAEYSRMKNYVKFAQIPYIGEENVYVTPLDMLRAKKVELIEPYFRFNFIDNLTEIILEDEIDVSSGTLKLTYVRYLKPEDIDERELDLFLMLGECMCFKLMASKTAELIKFSSGEKIVDESLVSKKYLELYEKSFKAFKKRAVKAYGRRVNNIKPDLDYRLPYPTEGETP